MAKIKGICKNYDECDLAAEKVVQEAEKTNFICSECGKPLYAVSGKPEPTGPNKKLLGAIAAVVVLVGGIVVGVITASGDKEPVEKPGGNDGTETEIVTDTGKGAVKDTLILLPDGADLGYAVWTGKMQDGKMHDMQGTLTFKSSHIIDSRDDKQRKANAGDKVIGTFENGHLVQGRWYKSDGNSESIILGSVD